MELEEKKKISEGEMKKERRKFLKKAAYAAPVLIAMGQLAKPTNAMAGDGSNPPGPPVGPADWV